MSIPAISAARLSDATDAELVQGARAGDMESLGRIYGRYASPIMGVAHRILGDAEAAEDVVHDVFVGLPEALRRYDERGKLGPWLKRVTARVALSALRTERAARETSLDDAHALSVRPRDEDSRLTLDAAVAALPSALRVVLVLKEIEGFKHAEIAEMLGISRGASEVRLHRAFAALRALLTKGDET